MPSLSDLATVSLRRDVNKLGASRAAYDNLREQHRDNVRSDPTVLGAQLNRTANAMVQQQERGLTSPAFGGQLQAAVRRMRARQGIVNRGDEAIKNQNLKDRIEIVRNQMKRRGQLQQGLQSAANIRQGVNVGIQDANQLMAQSDASLWGGVAGMATGYLKDPQNRANIGSFFRNIFNSPKPVATSTEVNLPRPMEQVA